MAVGVFTQMLCEYRDNLSHYISLGQLVTLLSILHLALFEFYQPFSGFLLIILLFRELLFQFLFEYLGQTYLLTIDGISKLQNVDVDVIGELQVER